MISGKMSRNSSQRDRSASGRKETSGSTGQRDSRENI